MVTQSELSSIISTDAPELLVKKADEIGRSLKDNGLTTSQIRALFGEVRQIQGQWSINEENRQKALRRLYLLKPKMAYRARKERGRAVQELVDVLSPALDVVTAETNVENQNTRFQRFVEFFEAILAYHKAYGGN